MSGVELDENNITIDGKIIETCKSVGQVLKESAIPTINTITQYPTTYSNPSSTDLTWNDNGYTIIVKQSDSGLNSAYEISKLFDNIINNTNSCYHSLLVYNASSPFQYQGSTTFRGNIGIALYIDLGRSIIPTYMALAPRETHDNQNMLSGAPGRFKIYASNILEDWVSTTSTTWELIHDQTSSLSYSYRTYTEFNFNSNSSPTTPYRYYVIVTTNLTGSYRYLMIGEWQIYGKEILEPSNSLIAHYKFDIPYGLYDSSGQLNHLTSINPLFDTTKKISGTSSVFENGISESYLRFPKSLTDQLYNINNTSGISFSLWYNIDIVGSNDYASLFEFSDTATLLTNTKRFSIMRDVSTTGLWIGMQTEGNIYSDARTIGIGTLDNTWHHLVWCIDIFGNWTIYLDGILQIGYTTRNLPQKIPNSLYNFSYIFKNIHSGQTKGNIDNFRIYERVLSSNEVSSLFSIKDIVPFHETIDDDYKYISFVNTGKSQSQYTINFTENTECDILIVGGGGGGGGGNFSGNDGVGGGGGAGGLVFIPNTIYNGSYNIIVGIGGNGMEDAGENGLLSKIEKTDGTGIDGINNFIAQGGGGGGDGVIQSQLSGNGLNGGSGGGGGGNSATQGGNTTQNTYNGRGFGKIGGRSITSSGDQSGGGGGAGGIGQHSFDFTSFSNVGGEGGIGLHKLTIGGIIYVFKDLFGTNVGEYLASTSTTRRQIGTVQDYIDKYNQYNTANLVPTFEEGTYFAGGGGGSVDRGTSITFGGLGGGGSTDVSTNTKQEGINGTGGGGTGGGKAEGYSIGQNSGTKGGSGIVIIRYKIIKESYNAQWTYNDTNPNVYHLGNVGIGTTNPISSLQVIGSITIDGSISALYKTFKIEHPLNINKWLYHGCVEGPRFDNIYRGKKTTINGKCEIDIDKECNTTGGMTAGTFNALNTSSQLYITNNYTYDRVSWDIFNGKIIINCENTKDNIEIDWLVIGERKDEHIINVHNTNMEGKLICEHNKINL